jgi:hypothetical protein
MPVFREKPEAKSDDAEDVSLGNLLTPYHPISYAPQTLLSESRLEYQGLGSRRGAQIKGHGLFDLNMDPGYPFLKALRARRSPRRLVREGCE